MITENIKIKKDIFLFNKKIESLILSNLTADQYEEILEIYNQTLTSYGADYFIQKNIFSWINLIVNVHKNENTLELFYPIILSVLLRYTENIKEIDSIKNENTPLKDIIVNFANLVSIDIDIISDICNFDNYFRKFIEREFDEEKNYKNYHPDLIIDLFDW